MKFRVVNVHHESCDHYMGRDFDGRHDGLFGSPIHLNRACPECGMLHKGRGDSLPCYKIYFERRVAEDRDFACKLFALADRQKELNRPMKLGCHCKKKPPFDGDDNPCHVDVIVEFLENL